MAKVSLYSGSSHEQGLERLAWIDRGTCAPLPFHITGGQPVVGQGVVVHHTSDIGQNPRHTFLKRVR
ncbi:unnamed protein product [Spirodela intermedia]|uniref:Uncharacterized protein n=1 Tax=Spirodela intermedia TaxID=51605 RepID=A0A7I8JQJ8_SPIIN|nr:unnamed protein product [Spirodela intermedia]CAA6672041.1 unnamed protein product [Spirodela intermedia]